MLKALDELELPAEYKDAVKAAQAAFGAAKPPPKGGAAAAEE